ncbi:MAG: hypothetical protein PVH19_12170, partial [Planctomycetia bacterium]
IGLAVLPIAMEPTDKAYEYGCLIFNATPPVLLGISLALLYGLLGKLLERRATTVVGLLLFVGTMITLYYGGRCRLLETLAGLGFMLMALAPLQAAWVARVAKLGGLAYGIYLSHLLFIKVAEAVANQVDLSLTWHLDLGVFLFAAAGSTFFAWLLSKWSWTKWLVV